MTSSSEKTLGLRPRLGNQGFIKFLRINHLNRCYLEIQRHPDFQEISIRELITTLTVIQSGTKIYPEEFAKLKEEKYKKNIINSSIRVTNNIGEDITDNQIICKNLLIDFSKSEDICFHLFNYQNKKLSMYTNISFERVIFLAKTDKDEQYDRKFIKAEHSYLHFNACFFNGINIVIEQVTFPGKDSFYSPEKRYGDHAVIKNHAFKYDEKNFETLPVPSIHFKDTVIKDYCSILCYVDSESRKGSPIDLGTYHIKIENCYFSCVRITGVNLVLEGNIIKDFLCINREEKFTIFEGKLKKVPLTKIDPPISAITYWGAYQKITVKDSEQNYHRQYLIGLKKQAEKRQDQAQVGILSREIAICEHNILKNQSLLPLQDKLTLWFNQWVSNYGTSWTCPLFCLIVINLLATVFILWSADCNIPFWDSLTLFANMFNPLSSLSDTLRLLMPTDPNNLSAGKKALISVINIVQKIGLAILTYEIIRAGRRFTRQYEK